MDFTSQNDPMYRGLTVNWVDVDKSKLYSHPKFPDKCTANDYNRKYGFNNELHQGQVEKNGQETQRGNKCTKYLIVPNNYKL